MVISCSLLEALYNFFLIQGIIVNKTADYLEIVPCLDLIPEDDRPNWKMLCKGMHPQIQNNSYENNTLYLKKCIHKYKTTGMKTTLFI